MVLVLGVLVILVFVALPAWRASDYEKFRRRQDRERMAQIMEENRQWKAIAERDKSRRK
jgi:hypothetical protein